MSKSERLLQIIVDEVGSSTEDVLASAVFDGLCPGVCIKCESVVDDVEPDATANWCDNCHLGTVRSALVLAECI